MQRNSDSWRGNYTIRFRTERAHQIWIIRPNSKIMYIQYVLDWSYSSVYDERKEEIPSDLPKQEDKNPDTIISY